MRRRLYLRIYFAFLGVLVTMGLVSAGINLATGHLGFWARGGPHFASHVARLLPAVDDPGLERAVDELHDELAIDLTVLDRDGRPAASAGVAIPPPDPREGPPGPGWVRGMHGVIAGTLRGGGLVLVRLPVPEGRNWHLRPVLLLVAALLASLLLVYPLSRSITRPVEQLTAAVEAYGKGDLGKRSGLEASQDEVGRLARAFDEMADRIQAARKGEKELLANVSHELRTPLARIRVAMALVDASRARDPAVAQRLATVDEELDELERLIADVLTSSKLELSAQPLRREQVALSPLLAKSSARALLLSQQVIAEIEPGLEVNADEALLARAIDNLIDNARKYGGKEPLRVEARRADGAVVIAVRDHGPGFAPDELERVFDPFYRGNSARGQASGFGLGLSLARRVAEAHGGSIRAANPPGGGALIELRLPA
jgi:two-component system OmpR family sensor kinase